MPIWFMIRRLNMNNMLDYPFIALFEIVMTHFGTHWTSKFKVNPCGAETEILQEKWVITMNADVLIPFTIRSSVIMVLAM